MFAYIFINQGLLLCIKVNYYCNIYQFIQKRLEKNNKMFSNNNFYNKFIIYALISG